MATNPALRRKGTAGVRSWQVLDHAGRTQVVDAGKHSIMRRTGLPGRDLRVLDPFLSYPSTILGREKAIVVNLEQVKAIIMSKEVLLLNTMDPFVSPFADQLRRRILDLHHASKPQADNANDPNSQPLFEAEEEQLNDPSKPQKRENTGSSQLQDEEERRPSTHQKQAGPQSQALPFEFVALEACLEIACSSLETQAKGLEQEAYPALDKLTSHITTLDLDRVRQIKSRLVAITGRVQKVRDELEHLLDDDDDMAEMYLTDKMLQRQLEEESSISLASNDSDTDDEDAVLTKERTASPQEIEMEQIRSNKNGVVNDRGSVSDRVYSAPNSLSRESNIGSSRRTNLVKHQVAELEMLLEAYFVQIDGTLNKLSTLREYVDDTEDYINIMLDDKQNQLLQMGIMLTTATLVCTVYIVVTGIFGMNIRIPIFLTDTPTGMPRWLWATGGGTAGVIVMYVMAVTWYKYKGYID